MKTANQWNNVSLSAGFLFALAGAAWLAVPALGAGQVQGAAQFTERAARTNVAEAEPAKVPVSCARCKNVWDWGPAYWRWGYSPGVWDVPSNRNWPSTPYYQPTLKHLCPECKTRYEKRGEGKKADTVAVHTCAHRATQAAKGQDEIIKPKTYEH